MTNGPNAVFAEIVENQLPKDRRRADFHRHPLYYATRNHIIDFLIASSRSFAAGIGDAGFDRRNVPMVRPGGDAAPGPSAPASTPSLRLLNRERTGS